MKGKEKEEKMKMSNKEFPKQFETDENGYIVFIRIVTDPQEGLHGLEVPLAYVKSSNMAKVNKKLEELSDLYPEYSRYIGYQKMGEVKPIVHTKRLEYQEQHLLLPDTKDSDSRVSYFLHSVRSLMEDVKNDEQKRYLEEIEKIQEREEMYRNNVKNASNEKLLEMHIKLLEGEIELQEKDLKENKEFLDKMKNELNSILSQKTNEHTSQ